MFLYWYQSKCISFLIIDHNGIVCTVEVISIILFLVGYLAVLADFSDFFGSCIFCGFQAMVYYGFFVWILFLGLLLFLIIFYNFFVDISHLIACLFFSQLHFLLFFRFRKSSTIDPTRILLLMFKLLHILILRLSKFELILFLLHELGQVCRVLQHFIKCCQVIGCLFA